MAQTAEPNQIYTFGAWLKPPSPTNQIYTFRELKPRA